MARDVLRVCLWLGAIAQLTACAGISKDERVAMPDWFIARLDGLEGGAFPRLDSVPQSVVVPRPGEDWAAIEADLRQAGRDLATSPRNVPADLSDLAQFEGELRDAFETPRAVEPAS